MKTLLLPILLLLAAPLAAQTCIDTDTPQTCWEKFVPAIDVSVKTTEVGTMVTKTNTGPSDLSRLNLTSLRDFLSVFTAAFQTATIDEENGAYVIDYNLPIDLVNANDVIKFQAKLSEPALDTSLTNALTSNAAAITTLSGSLDETDDISFSVTYSPANERFGRSLAGHRPLIQSLVSAVSERRGADSAVRRGAALGNALARAGVIIQETDPFTNIPDATKRRAVIDAVVATGQAAQAQFADQDKTITAFAELLSNQEQIYVSGVYRALDPIAGPSTATVKGTYELGGKNLSKFMRYNRTACSSESLANETGRGACLDAFNAYVANQRLLGWRVAATLDYQRTLANTINLPEYSVNLTTPAAESNMITFTAGRRLDDATSNRERRIDIAASYQNVTGDPNRDDRLVIVGTWTQELSDNIYLPITLTWANKEQYLGAQNDKLGVHFGVSYKLTDQTP